MTVLALATRQHTVGIDVSGADPIKGMQPDHLHMSWSWRPDTGWRLWKVELTGYRLKKDGTTGQQPAAVRLTVPKILGPVEYIAETPGWVKSQVLMHTPTS